jgi:hypothetical protein
MPTTGKYITVFLREDTCYLGDVISWSFGNKGFGIKIIFLELEVMFSKSTYQRVERNEDPHRLVAGECPWAPRNPPELHVDI